MKKIILHLCFLIFLTTYSEAETKFRLGISAPLSGVLAEYGTAVTNGLQLLKENEAELYSKIEMVIEDSQWDPKTAVNAFNSLKNIKNSDLIYNWGNPTSDAVAPLANRLGFPVIAMSSNHKITKNGNFVIRSIRSADELGELLAKHLIKSGFKNFGSIVAENSYVQGLYNGFQAYVISQGLKSEIIDTYDIAGLDFKSSILKAKQKGYDCLGVLLITGQIRNYFKQSEQLSFSKPNFGADFLNSTNEIKESGIGINGSIFPDIGVSQNFKDQYIKTFGNDIQITFAANAYDVVALVAKTFQDISNKKLNGAEIIRQLEKSETVKAAHGQFKYENSYKYGPTFVSDLVLRKIEGDKVVEIK